MTDIYKNILGIAKKLQDEADEQLLPPPEVTPTQKHILGFRNFQLYRLIQGKTVISHQHSSGERNNLLSSAVFCRP